MLEQDENFDRSDSYLVARRRVAWLLGLPHPQPPVPKTIGARAAQMPTPSLGVLLRSLRSVGLVPLMNRLRQQYVRGAVRWAALADRLDVLLKDDDG